MQIRKVFSHTINDILKIILNVLISSKAGKTKLLLFIIGEGAPVHG